jgi:hypothetical protein
MSRKILWLLCLFFAGCVAATSRPDLSFKKGEGPSIAIALTNIEKVKLGMTYSEVTGIMGDIVNIGYKKSDALEGAYEEVLVKSPYYEEIIEGSDARYRIVCYFTHIRKADGIITDDELTPLVFEEDLLIGKGRSFLVELKDRKNRE